MDHPYVMRQAVIQELIHLLHFLRFQMQHCNKTSILIELQKKYMFPTGLFNYMKASKHATI